MAYQQLKLIRNHQCTIIDQVLYIDGGEILPFDDAENANATNYQQNIFLAAVDLTQGTSGQDATIDGFSERGSIQIISKTNGVSSTIGGALFRFTSRNNAATRNKIVQFGGYSEITDIEGDLLWSYDTETETFQRVLSKVTKGANATKPDTTAHNGASAISPDGIGYYLGGYNKLGKHLRQLLRVDLNTAEIRSEPMGDLPPIVGSQLAWFPANKQGILVSIGGEMIDDDGRAVAVPMETIWVYDITSSTWYKQTATKSSDDDGLPLDRKFHCAVAANYTQTRSSYEIVLHAGYHSSESQEIRLDDLWALTVPTFQWVKYYQGATGWVDAGYGAYNVSCAMPGDRYFMVVGTHGAGQDFVDGPLAWFNLESLSWGDYSPTIQGYVVPTIVRNANSGKTGPVKWDNPNLENVFAETYTQGYIPPTSTATSSSPPGATDSPSTTSSPSPPLPSQRKSTNTGAIVGGVVGGLIGLVLLGALVWYLLRRRKQSREIPIPVPPKHPSTPSEVSGGPDVMELASPLPPVPRHELDGHYAPVMPDGDNSHKPSSSSSNGVMELA